MKNLKSRFLLSWVFAYLVAMVPAIPGTSMAQTPDGVPPSEETVCDELEGAAFGLCNAYCEAMDCDSEEPKASERACDRLFDRYMNKTGEEPPCEAEIE